MGILEGLSSGLLQALSLSVFPYLFAGAVFGLLIGVIPGLGGHFAMAMVIPFLYTMEPAAGIAFLLGAHSTVAQGGGLTAIFFSTPGTGQNAATLLDGPPMRDNGLGAVAAGAALTSCFLGASFGAVALAFLLPVLQRIVLFFGPPEIFMLAMLALTFVAVLGKEDITRSLIAALAGLLLAMIGLDNVTNQERFTFGLIELRDGLELVPVILGLFAVAEMFELWSSGKSLTGKRSEIMSAKQTQSQIFQGVAEAFKHWWLIVRCSSIGMTLGLIPGLGSAPASFIAYGHAKQSSKSKETFGRGNIEGVIGSESANDAVEGGALASTIAFGVPGSSSMAILLGALFILGVETGPSMLIYHVDVIFVMIFTIIIGNLIGMIGGVFLVNPISRATGLRSSILVPVLMVVIFTGAYAVQTSWFDISIALVFGIIGYLMKDLGYSRAALLIGFVLGFAVEKNLYLAVQLSGPYFVFDPIPLALGTITIVFLGYNIWSIVRDRANARTTLIDKPSPAGPTGSDRAADQDKATLELYFASFVGVVLVCGFVAALGYDFVSARTPLCIMLPMIILVGVQIVRARKAGNTGDGATSIAEAIKHRSRELGSVAGIIGLTVLLMLLIFAAGHYAGIAIFMLFLLRVISKESLMLSALTSAGVTIVIYLLFEHGFNIELYRGFLFRMLSGYDVN